MKFFWKNKKVLVTGGNGFIGSYVVGQLLDLGADVTVIGRSVNKTNLFNPCRFITGDCAELSTAQKACRRKDIVLNLAARVAGIDYNRTHQATMFRENLKISNNMLEAARLSDVERFLVVSSACVYPRDATIPTPETEGMRAEPEPTNGGYGWAKRIAEINAKFYAEEYGMKIGIVRPYNAYGPRDQFDDKYSHVIPALIKRIYSGVNPLIVWGSGKQTRSFLYVEDLAEAIIDAIEKYPVPDPINLGSDEEISIKDLVKLIMDISGKKLKIVFDTAKPDGSPRRKSDNTKAQKLIGLKPKTDIKTGLEKTIRWYLDK